MKKSDAQVKGAGELVLYLDYDGVLHHENVIWHPFVGCYLSAPDGYKIFQHLDLLEDALAPYPLVRIVLSTTWVRRYGCAGAAKNLHPSLRARVIGATFHSRMNAEEFYRSPRGMQVWGDVVRRKPKAWLALDDDYFNWPAWCRDRLVRSHEKEGISDPIVLSELKQKLADIAFESEIAQEN